MELQKLFYDGKEIIGKYIFDARYFINPKGDVFSLPKEIGFGAKTRIKKMKQSINNASGYKSISLRPKKDIKKTCFIHRLIAINFIENKYNKPCINHINGIKSDCSIKNLEWVTHQENCQHSWDTGLSKVSQKQIDQAKQNIKKARKINRKLSFKDAQEIRSKYKKGDTSHRKLAKEYGLNHNAIRLILNNETYKSEV